MRTSRFAITLMICLAVPGLSIAATKKNANKQVLPDCDKVLVDGSGLSTEENEFLFSVQKTLMTAESLGFALGNDTVLGDFYAQRKGKEFNADLMRLKELSRKQSMGWLMGHDFDEANTALRAALKERKLSADAYNVGVCRVGSMANTSTNA
ncbi:hypothetical protein [Pseudomonas putida]|uniref:hypothetical protein n=1 Tax=Pseudomonas putida TaxID=303 RepID=UPI000981B190|nr:hypothetical protein [Pseudomonas putida]OMQ37147.1 hypothetical protein BKX96_11685 [Pseudomonas putida]